MLLGCLMLSCSDAVTFESPTRIASLPNGAALAIVQRGDTLEAYLCAANADDHWFQGGAQQEMWVSDRYTLRFGDEGSVVVETPSGEQLVGRLRDVQEDEPFGLFVEPGAFGPTRAVVTPTEVRGAYSVAKGIRAQVTPVRVASHRLDVLLGATPHTLWRVL